MMPVARKIEERVNLAQDIQTLLTNAFGEGRIEGVAYDTAWIARLGPHYPGAGLEAALKWLRQNQHQDGSWGAPLVHYHDRFISTLAAIITLREVGTDSRDPRRVQRGEDVLWKLIGRLAVDDHDTIGFPLLSAALAGEAHSLGLDVPRPAARYAHGYKKKVTALLNQPNRDWRLSPISFSLEGLRTAIRPEDMILNDNHSVSTSLAATAAYLMAFNSPATLQYVQQAMAIEGTGAMPALVPIEIFETVWGLNHLRLANAISPDDPAVRRLLDYLWAAWSPKTGVSHSVYFAVPDVDNTAACFTMLNWGGYPVNADVFNYYEREDHFVCHDAETNPSLSAHVRLLLALRNVSDHPRFEAWATKIVSALTKLDENGSFWTDKWHASPYYVNSFALQALVGLSDDLARTRFKWIMRTRNDDGGWGYLGQSTPEETAYCLEALLLWDRTVERIDANILDEAAEYLFTHMYDASYTPLWIGKSLYTPHHLVRAAVYSALHLYCQRG
jgi:halimadienyl-diphosphate synthase